MIRFIHTADIHFGMENYGKIDPSTGIHTRLLDFTNALNSCIDMALQQKVDFFLFAGDAYKTAHPTPTQQKLFLNCFLRLYQAGIPVVIIIGNHDHPLSFGKAHALDIFASLPVNGFTVISKPQTIQLMTKNGPVAITGIPWPTRSTLPFYETQGHGSLHEMTQSITAAVAKVIEKEANSIPEHIPAVLAGHLTVSSGIFSGSEKRAIYGNDPVFLPSQLARAPYDYVALGHLHRYQNLNPQGYPALVYSGSIERIDFGERKDQKGFCLVTIPEKNKAFHEFIPVNTRPFIQIEVTLTADHQTDQILKILSTYDLEDAVVKIVYVIPEHCSDKVDHQLLLKACASAHYVVGIIPQRTLQKKERRSLATQQDSIFSLFQHYCDQRPELAPRRAEILAKLELLIDS